MVAEDWQNFLVVAELARNYKEVARAANIGMLTAPNPLLEGLLPSLLYIRLASLIDDALGEYITSQGWTITKPLAEDLNGRIFFLESKGVLLRPTELHDLRRKRNTLAHQLSSACSWSELENAVQIGQQELENIKLVGPRPNYEFFSRRLHRELNQGEFMGFDFEYGINEGTQNVCRVQWGRSTTIGRQTE